MPQYMLLVKVKGQWLDIGRFEGQEGIMAFKTATKLIPEKYHGMPIGLSVIPSTSTHSRNGPASPRNTQAARKRAHFT